MNDPEEWRPVVGVPGYEVSSLGRCRSVDRWLDIESRSRSGNIYKKRRFYPGRLLTPYFSRYVEFPLGHRLRLRAHNMVAEAFLGPNPGGLWVLHGDGDPTNNRLDNLRYGTPTENHDDRRRHGRSFQGERNCQAKLTERDVLAIRADARPSGVVAAAYGVCRATVGIIRRGETWQHLDATRESRAA